MGCLYYFIINLKYDFVLFPHSIEHERESFLINSVRGTKYNHPSLECHPRDCRILICARPIPNPASRRPAEATEQSQPTGTVPPSPVLPPPQHQSDEYIPIPRLVYCMYFQF